MERLAAIIAIERLDLAVEIAAFAESAIVQSAPFEEVVAHSTELGYSSIAVLLKIAQRERRGTFCLTTVQPT